MLRFLLFGVAFIAVVAGQSPSLVSEFQQADASGRRRILVDAMMGRRPASETDIQSLLLAAAQDRDASLRREAIGSVGTILVMSAMPKTPPGQEWAVKLRAVGEALRPAVEAATREALPLLVRQLTHPSYIARTGVAQGIAGYGALAQRFLPELEKAMAAETHDITRKTIAGTISVVKR